MGALLSSSHIQVGLNQSTIANVQARLLQSANYSWEIGTACEALTELLWPSLSIFSPGAFPPPDHLNSTLNASLVLNFAAKTVDSKPNNTLALVANDEAVGDPASIGVAVLLANWTKSSLNNTVYSTAAGEQLDYLLNVAPRSPQGAISQRSDQVQLWADFIYMGPPFIAYFGVLQGGSGEQALLQIAYEQCSLYRDQLRDKNGLWRHVALGNWQDTRHWGTSNGWAAAGMLRVLQTMNHSSIGSQFAAQQANLTSWIQEIVSTTWSYQQKNGTLLNVLDDNTTFADSSSTALLASVTYRMIVFSNDTSLLDHANRALNLTEASIDSDGWLFNTVDPYTFWYPSPSGSHSPEGQAFVLLLHAAWREWLATLSS